MSLSQPSRTIVVEPLEAPARAPAPAQGASPPRVEPPAAPVHPAETAAAR